MGSSKPRPERTCYNCNKSGHLARDCPEESQNTNGGRPEKKCYGCGNTGHIARDCPGAKEEKTEEKDPQMEF